MKKIKGLLLFGIFSLFFGLSFGYDGSFTMFHNISSEYGVSNVPFLKYRMFLTIHSNLPDYYSGTSLWGISHGRTFANSTTFPEDIIPFQFSFYSPKGFSISGNNNVIFSLTPSTYSFFGSRLYNADNADTYPLIFSDSQDYMTFNNESILAYNGQTYNYGNYGSLKYCFYGVYFDLSCVFSSSNGYNLVNFSYDLDNDELFVSSGFLIIPLSELTPSVSCMDGYGSCSSFTGTSSLIIIDVDDVVYWNIVNCYGSNSIFDSSCSVLSKGYINGLSSSQFYGRSFLTLEGGGTIQNGLGYFSEIFYNNGNFYYRSNSVKTSFSSGAPYEQLIKWLPYSLLDLQNSDSAPDILNSVNGGGNNNQNSFPDPIFDGGVFDANTFLIEESIKCYLTSGEVCNSPFTYENSANYVNNYDHQERVRNSTDKTGYLTFNNSVDMLSQYCLNVNTIQYAFCSQLYLYEGSPITYYYNNGYFNYIISGSGWQVNLGTLWSGQLGYAYCEGLFCSNFNEGLPQYIRADTGNYSEFGFSGEYVSLDFFKNYFENGFFFQCPFSYSGSYFTIGGKLIDRLDKHDPLKPINCMIAGFSYGIKSSFFGDSKLGLSHSGVFLQNTGPFATRFYTFLDIVLSLGYIFLFSKLFKFLKKH